VVKNKNPTAGLAVGFDKSRDAIRTRPPRGATAARSVAGLDSNCDSHDEITGVSCSGQMFLWCCNCGVSQSGGSANAIAAAISTFVRSIKELPPDSVLA
jgi:hypothetical protein